MSDETGLRELIAEEISEQVAVSDLLGDGSLEDSVDADAIGTTVGGEFGARMGRELGGAVGREIHDAIADRSENGTSLSGLWSDLTTAARDAVIDALEGETAANGDEAVDEADETDSRGDEVVGDDEAADEDVSDNAGADSESEPGADDLEGLRKETLVEFLGIVSYSDLQSIAKDVDVRANLSREEMVERIVETVSESEDGTFTAPANEEAS